MLRPFRVNPKAHNLYSSWPIQLFDDFGIIAPLISGDMNENQAGQALENYLQAESPEIRPPVIALFNDPDVQIKIPSPSLRAAFAALHTTSGRAAVNVIISGPITNILWDEGANFIAKEKFFALQFINHDNKITFHFNPRYRGANMNPFLLTNMMAHEPLHHNLTFTALEEIICGAFDTFFLLEQMAKHPDIAADRTELGRRMMTRAIFRFNCGLHASLGLTATNGNQPVVPGSKGPYTSWLENFDGRSYDQITNWRAMKTPGNSLLGEYLTAIGVTNLGSAPDFSKEVFDAIDSAPYPSLSPKNRLAVARALRLEIPDLPNVVDDLATDK